MTHYFIPPTDNRKFLAKIKQRNPTYCRVAVRAWVRECFRTLQGTLDRADLIVDAGCGYRSSYPEVAEGLGVSPNFLGFDGEGSLLLHRNDFRPQFVSRVEDMPFRDESVKVIVCTEVLEHVPDPTIALQEMFRVLAQGGSMVVTIPGSDVPLHEKSYQRDYRRFRLDYFIDHLEGNFEELRIHRSYHWDKELNILIFARGKKTKNLIIKKQRGLSPDKDYAGAGLILTHKKAGSEDVHSLWLLRDDKPSISFPSTWSLVGGHIEDDEAMRDAVLRETQEELSLTLHPESVTVTAKEYHFSDQLGPQRRVFYTHELADFQDFAPSEGKEARWFALPELTELARYPFHGFLAETATLRAS